MLQMFYLKEPNPTYIFPLFQQNRNALDYPVNWIYKKWWEVNRKHHFVKQNFILILYRASLTSFSHNQVIWAEALTLFDHLTFTKR